VDRSAELGLALDIDDRSVTSDELIDGEPEQLTVQGLDPVSALLLPARQLLDVFAHPFLMQSS
jgi:hypothetical protein